MNPKIPPIKEAAKIPNFACNSYSGLLKASPVTNKDIVNPIDARSPTPNKLVWVMPSGSTESFSFIITEETPKTPITFPIINPNVTPKVTLLVALAIISEEKVTPAFAKAKMGMTIKLTKE